jgi:hypothetical protein
MFTMSASVVKLSVQLGKRRTHLHISVCPQKPLCSPLAAGHFRQSLQVRQLLRVVYAVEIDICKDDSECQFHSCTRSTAATDWQGECGAAH